MRLKSFEAVVRIAHVDGTSDDHEVEYRDGALTVRGLSPDQAAEFLRRPPQQQGGQKIEPAEAGTGKRATRKREEPVVVQTAATATSAAPVRVDGTATEPVAAAKVDAAVADPGSDQNEAWGIGPEIAPEILNAVNVSPILRFLVRRGCETEADLLRACALVRERAGERCKVLHTIDPNTLPARIRTFLGQHKLLQEMGSPPT